MGSALDLMELDDEHTEKLATMLQHRWGKEGAKKWQDDRNSKYGRGSWAYLKAITTESEAWRKL